MRNRTDSILNVLLISSCVALGLFIAACAKKSSSSDSTSNTQTYLYVSTGACQSGLLGTYSISNASNQLFRINTTTGIKDTNYVDYGALFGDSPVAIAPNGTSDIITLIQRSTSNRIDRVSINNSAARSTFSADDRILAGTQAVSIAYSATLGSYYVAKQNSVGRTLADGSVVSSGTLFNSSITGSCGPSQRFISVAATDLGNVLVTSGSTGVPGRYALVNTSGACLSGGTLVSQASAMTYVSTASAFASTGTAGYLLAATSGTLGILNSNTIHSYAVRNEMTTSGTFGTGVKLYDQINFPALYNFELYGISAMTYDPTGGHLYVASGYGGLTNGTIMTGYVIEKFALNTSGTNGTALTRVGTSPFYPYSIDIRCISGMFVQ